MEGSLGVLVGLGVRVNRVNGVNAVKGVNRVNWLKGVNGVNRVKGFKGVNGVKEVNA